MILHSGAVGRTPALEPRHPANPILWEVRLADDPGDPWGTYLGWAFAVNALLEYVGGDIPLSRGYRASMAGAAGDLTDGSWEGSAVLTATGLGEYVPGDPDGKTDPTVRLFDEETLTGETWVLAQAFADHAARVLDRLLEAVPEADRY